MTVQPAGDAVRGKTTPGSTPGSFAPARRDEVVTVELDAPAGFFDPTLDPGFDPLELAKEHDDHHMADKGIFTITLPNGSKVAWNTNGPNIVCPTCKGDKAKQANCDDCAGRGLVQSVPFCDRPWDEAAPGLFVGGHQSQVGDCHVTDQFDVVISLHTREGFGPDVGIEHHTHTMIDGPLDPADHERLHELADAAVAGVRRGDRVLVRCQAGMNRSGLVTAMAMVKLGWSLDQAIAKMRADRSKWVLFNDDFVDFLRSQEAELRGDREMCTACKGHGGFFGEACWDCQGDGFIS